MQATSTLTRSECDRQFSERIGYVQAVINRFSFRFGVRDDDVADNALCWAWQWFTHYEPPTAVAESPAGDVTTTNWTLHAWRAARWGFYRALRGTQWAGTRRQGYTDAMDRGKVAHAATAENCLAIDHGPDRADLRELLSKLPRDLRLIAECRVVGFTQAEIAKMYGVSLGTINRQISCVRVFVSSLLRRRWR